MPSIVKINVSQTVAPAPITLQSRGALVSQGATNLANGASALLTQVADLTPLLAAPLGITTLAWSGGTVVATTDAPIPGRTAGDVFVTTVSGAVPTGYNGLVKATVTGASTFTYPLAVNPGAETSPGTYTPPGQGDLVAQVNTFFAQGSGQSVSVLELGAGDQTGGPAALLAWINANVGSFYSFLVPRGWDASSGLLALIAAFEALTAKTYFFVTTTISTYQAYTEQEKCAVLWVEAPNLPLTEFSAAADFQHTLAYAPSSTNRMTQNNYAYLFGVTPYPTQGNGALLTALVAANVSFVGTGAEGGISTSIVFGGKNADGNDFTYWYSADWIQLFADQAIANAVINGSNNPLNPLYYNQNGINQLQDVVVQTVQDAITFGLATGTVARSALDGPPFQQALDSGTFIDQDVVNAVPFITYTTENPSAYNSGIYGGLSVVYLPQRGFTQIIFNINVSDLLTQ